MDTKIIFPGGGVIQLREIIHSSLLNTLLRIKSVAIMVDFKDR
jgi:hypothetical protein